MLSLWQDQHRSSAHVKTLAQAQVAELDRRIADLTRMRDAIAVLAMRCHAEERPESPILEELCDGSGAAHCCGAG